MTAVLAFVLAASAQNPPPQKDDQGTETFKVNVDVVNVFFNVKDSHGALIPGLLKDDFELSEDGGPQTIKYFSAESNQPLTMGILLDTSPSQQRVLGMEQEIGASFLRQVMTQKDIAFLISFDSNVDLLQDYTSDTRQLREGMRKARIGGAEVDMGGVGGNPVPTQGSRGATKLYDAVYLAAREQLAQETGRKAMILLTDGGENGSRVDLAAATEAAQKADVICYVLLVEDRSQQWAFQGDGLVKKLTTETGGRVIDVGSNPEKLKEAFDQISNELRSQYNIGYTSTNTQHDGSFRKIEIKSHKGYKIQARRGYYARSQQ
ncbi:MAG TPA: VWA domain-containing protein [Terriglobales bacterium]|nr:VWA domain-containing protein [Terriglobales bacterium]